jgi:hypothetical protein
MLPARSIARRLVDTAQRAEPGHTTKFAPFTISFTRVYGSHMTPAAAFQIVLDLARRQIVDERDHQELHAQQVEACDLLETIADNMFDNE